MSRFLYLLLLSLRSIGIGCQSREDRRAYAIGNNFIAAERYGTMLPTISQIDLFAFGETSASKAEQFRLAYGPEESFMITNHVILRGEEAERFAHVWRSQMFNWSGSVCFEPGFGIRFKTEGGWTFETAVCLRCRDFSVPVKGRQAVLGFGAGQTNFHHFSNVLVRSFLPTP